MKKERIEDVMTKNPVCCVADETVQRAAEIMKSENVGSVPVVESNGSGSLIGIVTDRDLAIHVVAEGRNPTSVLIQEVMTRNPITAAPNDDLEDVFDRMADNQIRRIPVVDRNNCIIGIIAQGDIATKTDETEKVAEVVEEISKP